MSKKTILTACVQRMKVHGLKGKLRDDAAEHFLAGARAANPKTEVGEERGYLAVLEALADVGADEDQQAVEAEFKEVDED